VAALVSPSMAITCDDLEAMIKAMDTDGDGVCTKVEFKAAYVELMKKEGKTISDANYDQLWARLDKDGSNDVSVAELAGFYGYDIKAGALVERDDMSDEDIMEMLALASLLSVDVMPEPAKTPEKHEPCTMVNLKTGGQSVEKDILELSQMGDCGAVEELIDKVLAEKRAMRIADAETGQTPLHMIARQGNTCEVLGSKLLEATGDSRDVNYPDLSGKTPLHVAAEFGQQEFVAMLLARGADPTLQVNKTGWSALHFAVQSKSVETVKAILGSNAASRQKHKLLHLADSTDRTSLHVAAYTHDDEEMVKLLLEHGADRKTEDRYGNKPGCLARKGGRKGSRELLEEELVR